MRGRSGRSGALTRDPAAALEALAAAFVDGRLPAAELERRHLAAAKGAARIEPEAVFPVLDALFADVDGYCADPVLRAADGLDEAQLRDRARVALERVRDLRRLRP